MNDVIVIGGGPSGLHTAGLLADSGLDVKLFEKKNRIGEDILCTGIIGKEAFERFGLKEDSILSELAYMNMVSPSGTSLRYDHGKVFACVVDRKKFDLNLAHKALSCGAQIFTGTRVENIRNAGDYIEVSSFSKKRGETRHRAKIAVLATGIEYRLHKKIGLGYPKNYINGAQVELDVINGEGPLIMVGSKVAPGAFAWNIPVRKNRTRLGLITEKDAAFYLKKLVSSLYPEKVTALESEQFLSKIIAQGPVSKTYSHRVIAVGEAAAQVKTTTGGGIYYGLLCSKIAAETILRKFPTDSFELSDLSEYERSWKKAIKRELLVGYFARRTCGRLGDKDVEKLFQLAKTNGVFPLIRERGKFDWQVDLILELAKKASIPSLKTLIKI